VADRTVNVKLKADVAQYMAAMRAAGSATGDLDKAARELRRAHDEEADAAGNVRVAESRLNELRADSKTKVSQLAAAEEQLSRAHRTLENAQEKTAASTERFTIAQKAAGEAAGANLGDGMVTGFNRRSGEVDSAAEKVARRTEAQFSALKFAGLSAGLPAAGAIGAVGLGAALTVIPALFAGIAAKSLSSNEAISTSFTKLNNNVVDSVARMSAPLEGTFLKVSDKLGASFRRMGPEIQTAMLGSEGAVLKLTDGVTNLAEHAMPGMVNMVKTSGAALDGMGSLLSDVGAGLGDMFTNMSKGSEGAGAGLKATGGIIRDLEGFAGSLFTNLANGSAGPLTQFQGTLHSLEDTALSLTSNGMPALQGTTSGFLNVVSGGIGIIKAGADALGSWAQPAASMGGSLLATNSIAKLFGTSLGETGFGLKAFATSTDEAGRKTSPFRAALADTEAGGNKLTRGLRSVADNGLNPMGLAIIAGGFLLDKLGESQQKAAEAAAAHRENVRSLTDAIRADNGVMGEHSNAVNVDALTSKNAASNLAIYGGTLSEAKLAIQGNTGATAILTNKSDDLIASFVRQSGMTAEATKGLQGINHSLLQNGGTYESVAEQVTKFGEQTTLVAKKNADGTGTLDAVTKKLTASQREQLVAIFNGNGAIGEQVKAQREAYDAYLTSESALSGLTTEQVRNRDATNEATTAMYNQQNAQLGYRGAVLSSQEALVNLKKVNEDAKSTELDKEKALLAVERAFAAQEQSAYNTAYANSTATTEAQKVTEANRAMNQETVKLANTMGNNLPASMQATISKMAVTEAQAAGLTVGVNKTGEAVYRLPNGKEIKISADTGQAVNALAEVKRYQDALYNKQVTYTINVRQISSGQTSQPAILGGRPVFNAKGNLYAPAGVGFADGGFPVATAGNAIGGQAVVVQPGTLKWAGDAKVPEVFAPLDGSKRTAGLLMSAAQHEGLIGQRAGVAMAAGGMIQAEDGSWVPESFYSKAPAGPHAMYTASGFAKLTAAALANGISSLSAMDQNQLRTYGGWTDVTSSPVQQAISAGTAVQSTPRFSSQYSMAGNQGGGVDVSVFIDGQEFRGMVRTEVRNSNRATKRAVTAGAGRSR